MQKYSVNLTEDAENDIAELMAFMKSWWMLNRR